MNSNKVVTRKCAGCTWAWGAGDDWECMCPLPQWVVLEDTGFSDVPKNPISPNDDATYCDAFSKE
jgi:hypothetical protein